jgi:hypothetical protein
MSLTQQVAEQAMAKADAEDTKKTDSNGGDDEGDKKPPASKDADTGEQAATGDEGKAADDTGVKYDKDGKRVEAAPDDKKVEDKAEEGKFTVDDALEVETPEPKQPEAPKDNAGVVLSKAEQEYLVKNIGEPIIIRGMQGEGDAAKEVEIKAYSPADIPADFKFANDQQRMAAQSGFVSLEQKAQGILADYRQNQSKSVQDDFDRRENQGIKDDIADLQKAGQFPKFSVRPGDEGFDDSPEAQVITDVLTVMRQTNENYMKQYEQGRPYKHIGFAEAYEVYQRSNPSKKAEQKANDDQAKEDRERAKTAEDSRSNRGASASTIVKPSIRPGTTIRDILNRVDSEEW